MSDREFDLVAYVMSFDPEDRARIIRSCCLEGHPDLEQIEANLADPNGGFNQRLLAATRVPNTPKKGKKEGGASRKALFVKGCDLKFIRMGKETQVCLCGIEKRGVQTSLFYENEISAAVVTWRCCIVREAAGLQ